MKKIKRAFTIGAIIALIIDGIIVSYVVAQYQQQKENDVRMNMIQAMIDAEIQASKPEEKPSTNPSLDDIISGSLNDSIIETAFSNITMHNASTFTALYNGEEHTFRLIGVADTGNINEIKSILESLTKIVITYDVMKTKKGDSTELIYLWNESNNEITNMINLKIVRDGFASTTYLGTGYSEHPNVAYCTQFVAASKGK